MPYSSLNFIENNIKSKSSCFFSTNRETFKKNVALNCRVKTLIEKSARSTNGFNLTNHYVEIYKVRSNTCLKLCVGYSKYIKKFSESKVKDFLSALITPLCKEYKIDVIEIDVNEVERPMLYAFYVAQMVERDLVKNISIRKLTRIANNCIIGGAQGCAIEIKGRINGYEISRKDKVMKGCLKRNTFSSDISYCQYVTVCKSGCIGVKVWVNKGNTFTPSVNPNVQQ